MKAPSSSFDPRNDWGLIRQFYPFLKPHAFGFWAAVWLMPLSTVASVMQPYLIKRVVDAALISHSGGLLSTMIGWFGLALVVEFSLKFAQTYWLQLAGQRAIADLRRHVFARIQAMPLSYLDHTPSGVLVTRVTNDISAMGELFASGAVTAIGDVLLLLGIVGVMLSLDWQLSLIAFFALPFVGGTVELCRRKLRSAYRETRARTAELNAFASEQVVGFATVRSFGKQAACADEYRNINEAYRRANKQSVRYDALLYSVVDGGATICIAAVIWFAAVRLHHISAQQGVVYVGTAVAFYEYIQRFFVPVRDLASKYAIVQASLASAERISDLLALKHGSEDQVVLPPQTATDVSKPAIYLSNVWFGYRPDVPVLRGIDLTIMPGERVGIVGSTGAGKTTLLSVLLKLYPVTEGEIQVLGTNINDWNISALRRSMGVVLQDAFMFQGTLADNVTLGDEEPNLTRAEAILRELGAWNLLAKHGHGLQAQIYERGSNLSAGERQLIALARILYRDARIVFFDEATANLDSATEQIVQNALEKAFAGRTALVIAHRLATVRAMDRLIVFHKGKVVESGSHDQLLMMDGVYAKLYKLNTLSA